MPAKGKGREKKKAEKERKVKLREKLSEALDLPKEVVLNIPKITMVGNGSLVIENYKGVMEYEDNRIRINTGSGVIKITGSGLSIKVITSESVLVDGAVSSLEFIK